MSAERMPPAEHYPPHRDNDQVGSARPDEETGARASGGSGDGARGGEIAPFSADAMALARYQALLEQAVDAIFVAHQEHFVEVNPAACALLGYSRAALLGMHIVDLVPPEDVPRMEVALGEMSRGETYRGEWRLRRKDGSFVSVEVSARLMPDGRWQAIARDITGRKRLERELRERTEQLVRTFEAMCEGVYIYDAAGGLVGMNGAARSLVGYDLHPELEREPIHERLSRLRLRDSTGLPMPPEDWPVQRVLHGETFTSAAPIEVTITTPAGHDMILHITGAALRDADEQIVGAVMVWRDVTEQRRLEQQRMEIFSVVAHDLANPLAAIKMFLQMQQRAVDDGRPARMPDPELVGTLAHSVVRMERLVGDMRMVVGLVSNKLVLDRQASDLVALCQQEARSMQMAEMRAPRVSRPDEPVIVWADSDRIGQVLANLLSNADRYSPVERPITLTLRVEGATSGSAGATARQARVLVEDEGQGIPKAEQEHIWERFHRVPGTQPRAGTGGSLGLGLYISREIIERHGGTMGVESTPGKGSTFWFTLPLEAPA